MPRVLVQELKCPGHCVPYAMEIANTLASSGDEVLLVLNGEMRERAEAILRTSDLSSSELLRIEFTEPLDLYNGKYNSHTAGRLEVDVCSQFTESFNPQRVVLPTAGGVIRQLARDRSERSFFQGGSFASELIVHSLPGSVPAMSPRALARWWVGRSSLGKMDGIRILSPDPYATLGPGRKWLGRRTRRSIGFLPFTISSVPDISREQARRNLGLPESGYFLVVPGVIDPRKSIERLLRERASLMGLVDGILLAGPVAKFLEAKIEAARDEPGPPIYVRSEYMDTPRFNEVILASDLIWAVYPHWRGLASIQLIAASFGRMCLLDVSHHSSVWIASHGQGGVVLKDSLPDAVREASKIGEPSAEYREFIEMISLKSVYDAVVCEEMQVDSMEALKQSAAQAAL